MNYYPANFYSNYPQSQQPLYGYNQAAIPSYQAPQTSVAAQSNQIPGKIVDSQEVARVSDIPFGGYGIFPKADLSEVYVKMWNNNGTTSLVCFKPIVEGHLVTDKTSTKKYLAEDNNTQEECSSVHEKLLSKLEELEEKIDEIQKTNTSDKVSIIKRKE